MSRVFPIILSGGAGTRLWPLSRAARPKQLLRLCSERTMIQDTVLRLPGGEPPILICNEEHRFLVAEQMQEIGVAANAIVLEPVGRNTGPAAILASLLVERIDPEGIILLLPSDHLIANVPAFHAAVAKAVAAARGGLIVTFGITPSGPHTGYGYIRSGEALVQVADGYKIERFIEKPDLDAAESLLKQGGVYWNSGMFVFRARTLLDEAKRIAPGLRPPVEQALQLGRRDADFLRLDQDAFRRAESISIDHAIMEHTQLAAVVPADIGWNDIGSWSALFEAGSPDERGNVARGDVILHGATNCFVRAEGTLVAVVGLEGAIVVATKDAVLVTHRRHSQDVKAIVERLKREGRGEV
jgi:mannose-1-phosphate guanylyltransferase/mannose-6-phosphate isomerase